jgi:hypothetical protein
MRLADGATVDKENLTTGQCLYFNRNYPGDKLRPGKQPSYVIVVGPRAAPVAERANETPGVALVDVRRAVHRPDNVPVGMAPQDKSAATWRKMGALVSEEYGRFGDSTSSESEADRW